MSYAKFCATHGITITTTRTLRNPHFGDNSDIQMDNWHVMLAYAAPVEGGRALRSMKLHFSKGKAHHGAPPTAPEVLESLLLEALAFGPEAKSEGFAEWAHTYGFNDDSIAALRTFQASLSLSKRLREFLSPALFVEALQMAADTEGGE